MSEMLPVAILAGGLATRLRPLTDRIPKSLAPVCGEPFVAHQARLLADQGIRRVVVCSGHLGHLLEAFLGDGRRYGLDVAYSADRPRPLGTGGAIRNALPLLGDKFFILYGDSYLPCDWRAVQHAFMQSGRSALMTVVRNDGRWDTSNAEVICGDLVRYDKQARSPTMLHIDYGLGVFQARPFEELAAGEPADLAQVYQRLLARGQLACHELDERFYEIGSFAGLRELEQFLSAEPKQICPLESGLGTVAQQGSADRPRDAADHCCATVPGRGSNLRTPGIT
jgi:NDP-sugar pyrophosphorylase family protein